MGVMENFVKSYWLLGEKFNCNDPFAGLVGQFSGIFYNKTKNLDVREINKFLRKDINDAVKKKFLSNFKYKVRKDDYNSIRVMVEGLTNEDKNYEFHQELREKLNYLVSGYSYDLHILKGDVIEKRLRLNLETHDIEGNYYRPNYVEQLNKNMTFIGEKKKKKDYFYQYGSELFYN